MRIKGPPETHNRHKTSFSEQVLDVIRISDIIIETLDARYITESRIPELEKQIIEEGKILVHVVMKVDLVNLQKLKMEQDISSLSNPIFVSCKKRIGVAKLREKIYILSKRFKGHTSVIGVKGDVDDPERVITHANVHIGVIGYPNTGKSSLIGILARRGVAPISRHPGFTKAMRKIRFSKGILLLDVPGVMRGKENLFTDASLKKHSLLGVHVPENVRSPDLIVHEIMKNDRKKIDKYYGVDSQGDVEIFLEELGKRWNLLKKKGVVDTDKTARRVLRDWHEGKFN